MPFRVRTALAVVAALACGGCGLGAGPGTRSVSLTVTRNFGTTPVRAITDARVPGSETVMRMLERSFTVTTRGGGSVESIDGLSPGNSHTDWFYYVNGIEAPQGAAATAVHGGDHIWWDLHDRTATDTIPAVVGSFPEPFENGYGGRLYPTTVECASDVGPACTTVGNELAAEHIRSGEQTLGTGSGSDTFGVVVGTWNDLRSEIAAQLLAHGPGASGVYAHFGRQGATLQLLDPAGSVVRTLGAGAGLIAAIGDAQQTPTWLVTGTDAAGVEAAARSLRPQDLHDRFALAVHGATVLPVPQQASQSSTAPGGTPSSAPNR
ncbi:MAG: DUF4430 domain-containing protein [Solirubrobacteraceae bacterium]